MEIPRKWTEKITNLLVIGDFYLYLQTDFKQELTMTPQEERNQKLAERLIKNLGRRHIEACYCPTGAEAVRKVSELIADGSTVTWGGTATVRDLGIPQVLKERGTLNVLDRDTVDTPEEKQQMYLRAFSADVYLTSANAISEDGVIVNVDGNGNRVAAISWGPKRVIFVIGLNKVAQTQEAAIARARGTASPINTQRFDIQTPCRADGVCHDCNSPDSICSYIHLLRNNRTPGRHVVVLVGESLGY